MLRIEILSHIYLSQNSCDGRIKFGFVLYRQGSHNMEQLTFFYSKLQKLLLSQNIYNHFKVICSCSMSIASAQNSSGIC